MKGIKMYIVKENKKISRKEIALGYYTYILHMKMDVENDNIYFVYCKNNKYYRIMVNIKRRIYF